QSRRLINGRRGGNGGAIRSCPEDGTARYLVARAARRGPGPRGLHHLRHLGGAAERPLFHRALLVALLLALPGHELRPPHPALRHPLAPDPGDPGAVDPGWLSADLLLLPQGLLPLLLLGAARL